MKMKIDQNISPVSPSSPSSLSISNYNYHHHLCTLSLYCGWWIVAKLDFHGWLISFSSLFSLLFPIQTILLSPSTRILPPISFALFPAGDVFFSTEYRYLNYACIQLYMESTTCHDKALTSIFMTISSPPHTNTHAHIASLHSS